MLEKMKEYIDEKVPIMMKENGILGVGIAIVIDGKLTYSSGFGTRDPETNLPWTPETLYRIASTTKPFIATAIMQLVEQGKIKLDDPVSKHLDFKLGDSKNPITIHHLLSHSSGVPALNGTLVPIAPQLLNMMFYIPMSSKEDFLRNVNGANDYLIYKPGEHFMYNNDLYQCLGLIIENVSGMKFEDYIKENILKPLQMNRSTFSEEEYNSDSNAITGYLPGEKPNDLPKRTKLPFGIFNAPGGLNSTIEEQAKFMIALMNGGKTEDGKEILKESTLKQMWTPYIETPKVYVEGEGGYGYGWSIDKNYFGETLVGHGGNVITSANEFLFIPSKKMGVIIGTNTDNFIFLHKLVNGLLALYLGHDFEKENKLLQIQAKQQKLVGKYKNYIDVGSVEIVNKLGMLYLNIKIGARESNYPLIPENIDEYKYYYNIAQFKMSVRFIIDKKERIYLNYDRNLLIKQ
jgi:CubicO group peptidase (beta-lactamase class C family)